MRALKLVAAAASVRHALGTPPTALEQRRLEETLRPVQARLGAAERARGWTEGSRLSIAEAMEYAVSDR